MKYQIIIEYAENRFPPRAIFVWYICCFISFEVTIFRLVLWLHTCDVRLEIFLKICETFLLIYDQDLFPGLEPRGLGAPGGNLSDRIQRLVM